MITKTSFHKDLASRFVGWSRFEGEERDKLAKAFPLLLEGGFTHAAEVLGVSPQTVRNWYQRACRRINNIDSQCRYYKAENERLEGTRDIPIELADLGVRDYNLIREVAGENMPSTWRELYFLWPRLRNCPTKKHLAKAITNELGKGWKP
jgi:hypothetical protein